MRSDESQASGPLSTGGEVSLVTGADQKGQRLDRVLAAAVPTISRSRLQALIREGALTINGQRRTDPGYRLAGLEHLVLSVPAPVAAEPKPEHLPLAVIYEDAHVIVIDKPAGLVVHPAAGHDTGTLVNALIAHCGESLSGIGGVRRPGIVHRLDKDTSGLLVVAKTDAAHAGLSKQFKAHGADGRLRRAYFAVVWGVPARRKGSVDAALSRSERSRVKIAVVPEEAGRHAVTHYEVVETYADRDGEPVAALLKLHLETGRTHQIRVHMAHIGHPLLGDQLYGSGFRTRATRLDDPAKAALEGLGRQALHAAELGFEHPVTGQEMVFASRMPEDMERLVNALQAVPSARRTGDKRPAGKSKDRRPPRR